MSKSKWDKIAEQQFKHMPTNFQSDWQDLRHKVSRN